MESDSEKFFPSKWLRAPNITEPVDVTITKAYGQVVEGSLRDKEESSECAIVEFDELEKPLILNKTNFKAIGKIAGQEEGLEKISDWPGTVVNLFVMKVQTPDGIKDGIRIQGPRGSKVEQAMDKAQEEDAAQGPDQETE